MASKCTSRGSCSQVGPALDLNFLKYMHLLTFGLHVYWNYYGGESPAAIATLLFNLFQVQSQIFLFSIYWELKGVRTLWARVANLAFLKPDSENLAFLTCLPFYFKDQKNPDEIGLLPSFLRCSALFRMTKKPQTNLFFLTFFLIFLEQ